MLSLRNVNKSYDDKVILHNVNLQAPSGAFIVIVGPSGCGKSTLLRMIAGLEDITSGEISIKGQRVNEIEPAKRGCAMVFQNYALYPHMSVAQNICYPLKIAKVSPQEQQKKLKEVAQILDLEPFLDRRPAQLSGGQRQRVAMGRAIVREPSLFLFDEPLSNLDAKLRVQMRIEIRRLHKRLGITSVFVTHDQIEAMTLADILVVMNKGKVEQIGTPADIYNNPQTSFVASFIGAPAMNLLPATIDINDKISLDFLNPQPLNFQISGKKGASILVGIRPEDIRLTDTDEHGFLADLDLVEDMGGSLTGFFNKDNKEIAVALSKNFAPRTGSFKLHFPSTAICCFDKETGSRIAISPNNL